MIPKNFALIGAAGYIAPRHMKAIRDTGNKLVSAFDPVDSVGILDSFGYDIDFFTNQRDFEMTLPGVDFVSVASPNYLHYTHCGVGLQAGCDVICEKPLATNMEDLDYLLGMEEATKKRIYTVLQLRIHPAITALRQAIQAASDDYEVSLNYITPRGKWYYQSWKGQDSLSGGLVFNIGIHLLDMLIWLFGDVQGSTVYQRDASTAAGLLYFNHAKVDWLLSINPEFAHSKTSRQMLINGQEIDFTTGFSELHTRVYQEILAGNGYGINDIIPAVKLASEISNAQITMKRQVLLHSCIGVE
jgi:UDP-N-acetyl-2-amino-2-deoxyglucuronate dehydrogenase